MKKKKGKKRFLKHIIFFSIFILIAGTLYYSSNKVLINLGYESYRSLISSASYNAIDEIIDTGYDYKNLFDISTNKDNEINMVVTNSYLVNSLATDIATKTYNYLNKKANFGVDVPLGAFTGIKLISGFGSKVKMKLITVSSVKCDIISNFTQAGINQTRHSLYLDINCTVSIVTKTATKNVNDKISVLIYDNLIIGKVPSVLVNSQIVGRGEENM